MSDRYRREMILGDPGFGKSWLLRWEARSLAREAARALEDRADVPAALVLPVLVRLPDLGRRIPPGCRDAHSTAEALLDLAAPGVHKALRRVLQDHLESGQCVLLMDAWDEVGAFHRPGNGRQALGEALETFVDRFPRPRLVLTSRLVGYAPPAIPGLRVLELMPFNQAAVAAFVRSWFGEDRSAAERFLAVLGGSEEVRGLAQIPLMLSFLCLAYNGRASRLPSSRVALYDRCLRGLLREWKEEREESAVSDAAVAARLELLEAVGYALAADGYDQFNEAELRDRLLPWLERLRPGHELYRRPADALIAGIRADGILVATGEDRDAPLRFLHRTFHEYLSARHVARAVNDAPTWTKARLSAPPGRGESVAAVLDRRAWLPEWHEILVLTAGMLKDPGPLVGSLAAPRRDDLFHHRLALAVCCLAEVPAERRRRLAGLAESAATAALRFWWDHAKRGSPEAVSCFERALAALAKMSVDVEGRPLLAWLRLKGQDSYWWVRNTVARAVGFVGRGAATPELLSLLCELLDDPERDVRITAAESLHAIGSPAATPELLTRLLGPPGAGGDVRPHLEGLAALGAAAGTPEVLDRLSGLMGQTDSQSVAAARAAAAIGSAAATPAVLDRVCGLLHAPDGQGQAAGLSVVSALGPAGARGDVLRRVAELLRAESHTLRVAAIEAAGRLGREAAVTPVLDELARAATGPEPAVRQAAARALARLGRAANVLDGLAARLNDPDQRTRRQAIAEVQCLGPVAATPQVVGRLAELLAGPFGAEQMSAAEAVYHLGPATATPAVLAGLARLVSVPDGVGVWWWGVMALAAMGRQAGDVRVLAALAELTRSPDDYVRRLATRALVCIGPKAADPAVLVRIGELLCDPDPTVRAMAAWAAGRIGPAVVRSSAVSRPLSRLLNDRAWADRMLPPEAVAAFHASGARFFRRWRGGWRLRTVGELAGG
jgi:HEAT repeat protein